MKVVKLDEGTPKQFLSPTLNPKTAQKGPKNSKTITKLSQNQMPEWKDTKEIKVAAI